MIGKKKEPYLYIKGLHPDTSQFFATEKIMNNFKYGYKVCKVYCQKLT